MKVRLKEANTSNKIDSHFPSRLVLNVLPHVISPIKGGLRHSIILQLLSSDSSIHYFTPKAANCCIRARRTLPTLWRANCVEWPVTAALLCSWLQYSLTPLPLCKWITMVTLLMQGPWLLPGGCLVVKESHLAHSDTLSFRRLTMVRQMLARTNKQKKKNRTDVLLLVSSCCWAYFFLWRRPF